MTSIEAEDFELVPSPKLVPSPSDFTHEHHAKEPTISDAAPTLPTTHNNNATTDEPHTPSTTPEKLAKLLLLLTLPSAIAIHTFIALCSALTSGSTDTTMNSPIACLGPQHIDELLHALPENAHRTIIVYQRAFIWIDSSLSDHLKRIETSMKARPHIWVLYIALAITASTVLRALCFMMISPPFGFVLAMVAWMYWGVWQFGGRVRGRGRDGESAIDKTHEVANGKGRWTRYAE